MDFLETVDTTVAQFNHFSGEESPLVVRHLLGEGYSAGIKTLEVRSREQEKEEANDKCPPVAQEIDQSTLQCEASATVSTAKQPSLFKNQTPVQLEIPKTPVFRQSAAPTPGQEYFADTPPSRTPRTPPMLRSSAPSLSDYSETVRSQSYAQQDNHVQPNKSKGPGLSSNEKSPAQVPLLRTPLVPRSNALSWSEPSQSARSQLYNQEITTIRSGNSSDSRDFNVSSFNLSPEVKQFQSTASDGPDELHLVNMRGLSWSPMTSPPASPLAPIIDMIDEDVVSTQIPSIQPASSVACQTPNEISETTVKHRGLNNCPPRTPPPRVSGKTNPRTSHRRTKGQNGRVRSYRPRQREASTRWSPVAPWSPGRKLSFNYDVQQRIAAATRGTRINNGLLNATVDYLDI
ncbi:uncharacterized protein ColSpa_09254 [Colletotrichum spaethianum]|uniref:Uncharacterized protein n=1 Tax=Colletotrichum spaethianum TaxID=700344 RepID=A0AA37PB83_9PEZI|nr:uncharacterized protein ColSpa_09254 [Colletotrichum spaethianum]GKT49073.1 hypothetical protein ColSpa_09254 [Colletotrichum spaethianum]